MVKKGAEHQSNKKGRNPPLRPFLVLMRVLKHDIVFDGVQSKA